MVRSSKEMAEGRLSAVCSCSMSRVLLCDLETFFDSDLSDASELDLESKKDDRLAAVSDPGEPAMMSSCRGM